METFDSIPQDQRLLSPLDLLTIDAWEIRFFGMIEKLKRIDRNKEQNRIDDPKRPTTKPSQSVDFKKYYKTCPDCLADVQRNAAFCTQCAFDFVKHVATKPKAPAYSPTPDHPLATYNGIPKNRAIEIRNDAMNWIQDPSNNFLKANIFECSQQEFAEILLHATEQLKHLQELARTKLNDRKKKFVEEAEATGETPAKVSAKKKEKTIEQKQKAVQADKSLPKELLKLRGQVVFFEWDKQIPNFEKMDLETLKAAVKKLMVGGK